MLKLGPSVLTSARSGKIHVSCDLPGLISLTSNNPALVLSPSSHTVDGVLDAYLRATQATGVGRRDSTLARTDNFAYALAFYIEDRPFWYSSGYCWAAWCHYWGSDSLGTWAFAINPNTNKLRVQRQVTGGTGAFDTTSTVPTKTWVRAVVTHSGTTMRIRTSSGIDEAFTTGAVAAPPWDGAGYESYGDTRLYGYVQNFRLKDFQFKRDGLPTDGQVAAYLAGTGDLSDVLLVKLSLQEESGTTAYDASGNGKNFTAEAAYSGSVQPVPVVSGLTRDITGLANTEADIEWSIPAGHEGETITVTATRTKVGFPASIATETDACTIQIQPVSVAGVTLDHCMLDLAPGETGTLHATVWPADATNQAVTWASSDTDVATVVGGVVTAVDYGTCTITVTTTDGGHTATCSVSVPETHVIGVTTAEDSSVVDIGGTATLHATVWPSDATDPSVTWSSSNEAVATVVGGVVTGVSSGLCTITVTTTDGGFTATVAITVEAGEFTGTITGNAALVAVLDVIKAVSFRSTAAAGKPVTGFLNQKHPNAHHDRELSYVIVSDAQSMVALGARALSANLQMSYSKLIRNQDYFLQDLEDIRQAIERQVWTGGILNVNVNLSDIIQDDDTGKTSITMQIVIDYLPLGI